MNQTAKYKTKIIKFLEDDIGENLDDLEKRYGDTF